MGVGGSRGLFLSPWAFGLPLCPCCRTPTLAPPPLAPLPVRIRSCTLPFSPLGFLVIGVLRGGRFLQCLRLGFPRPCSGSGAEISSPSTPYPTGISLNFFLRWYSRRFLAVWPSRIVYAQVVFSLRRILLGDLCSPRLPVPRHSCIPVNSPGTTLPLGLSPHPFLGLLGLFFCLPCPGLRVPALFPPVRVQDTHLFPLSESVKNGTCHSLALFFASRIRAPLPNSYHTDVHLERAPHPHPPAFGLGLSLFCCRRTSLSTAYPNDVLTRFLIPLFSTFFLPCETLFPATA